MAEKKEKRYVSDNAQLMEEWDWEANNRIGHNPSNLLLGSNKRAYWICSDCGHRWNSIIANRAKGNGCPICARAKLGKGKIVSAIKKSGTLAEKYPQIASEWGIQNELTPQDISPGSNKVFWWICPKGHSYKSAVTNRVQGQGCPICAGKKVLKGYNDLFTLYPFTEEIWDFSRNVGINPETCAGKSHKVVYWKCTEGHEWKAKISHVTDGHTCPYCAGQRAIIGTNDIKTTNPELAEEWDYEKNTVSIETVMQSSGKKYWWKCCHGHSWQATAAHRNAGEGCPICASSLRTSFPEKALLYYVGQKFSDTIGSYRSIDLSPYELDVFLPSINTGIEYDGEFYHQDISRDISKDELCNKLGIRLFRIREPNCPSYPTTAKFFYLNDLSTTSLDKVLIDILKLIGVSFEKGFVDINRDRSRIEELRVHTSIANSFGELYPHLVLEWNTERNGSLTPYSVTKSSGRKVWWICNNCGHEWESIVANRAKGSGCPACAKATASKRAIDRERKKKASKK